uniref:Uncharacterized protein n=1 Tax=Anopheles maculatus TaxID=74869 RepID=A0A182S752_9DIPT
MPILDDACSSGGVAGSTKLAAGDVVADTKEIAFTDYYSFLCDNQLSYESPSKSPGNMMRLELALARRPSTIEEVLQQQPPTPPPPPSPTVPPLSSPAAITVRSDTGCSVVKPSAANVRIGFDVSPVPASPVDSVVQGSSLESSFEMIEKGDAALMEPAKNLSSIERADGGLTLASGSSTAGHSFCNKLLQHIVTSVSGGRKGAIDATVSNECKKQDVGEGSLECSTADGATNSIRRSSSSSCSSLTMVPSAETGGSPVLARSNRCAPFSFRDIRSELRAAMKIPNAKPRTQTGSSSSSSSSNIASVVRSIERTLSAPVAVQTLESSAGNMANVVEFASFTGKTTASASTNASTANGSLLPMLN